MPLKGPWNDFRLFLTHKSEMPWNSSLNRCITFEDWQRDRGVIMVWKKFLACGRILFVERGHQTCKVYSYFILLEDWSLLHRASTSSSCANLLLELMLPSWEWKLSTLYMLLWSFRVFWDLFETSDCLHLYILVESYWWAWRPIVWADAVIVLYLYL